MHQEADIMPWNSDVPWPGRERWERSGGAAARRRAHPWARIEYKMLDVGLL